LHELYPNVRCKLMYRQDIADMGVKYGLFGDDLGENGTDK